MSLCVDKIPPGEVIAGLYVAHDGVYILSSPPAEKAVNQG